MAKPSPNDRKYTKEHEWVKRDDAECVPIFFSFLQRKSAPRFTGICALQNAVAHRTFGPGNHVEICRIIWIHGKPSRIAAAPGGLPCIPAVGRSENPFLAAERIPFRFSVIILNITIHRCGGKRWNGRGAPFNAGTGRIAIINPISTKAVQNTGTDVGRRSTPKRCIV